MSTYEDQPGLLFTRHYGPFTVDGIRYQAPLGIGVQTIRPMIELLPVLGYAPERWEEGAANTEEWDLDDWE